MSTLSKPVTEDVRRQYERLSSEIVCNIAFRLSRGMWEYLAETGRQMAAAHALLGNDFNRQIKNEHDSILELGSLPLICLNFGWEESEYTRRKRTLKAVGFPMLRRYVLRWREHVKGLLEITKELCMLASRCGPNHKVRAMFACQARAIRRVLEAAEKVYNGEGD